MASVRDEFRQFHILTRHFYNRFFNNDFITYEEEMKAKIISLLVLSASFFGYLSNRFLYLYGIGKDPGSSWVDKCYLMSYFMVIIACVAIIEWENIFPDSRDQANLVWLPIRIRTILAAKFASLCLFTGIFAIGTNAIAVIIFSWFTPEYPSNGTRYGVPTYPASSLVYGIRFVFSHLLTFTLAAYFVLFLLILIMAVFKSMLGFRLFTRLSTLLKTALLSGCVFLIILLFLKTESVSFFFDLLPDVKRMSHPLAYIFPPIWFTGLNEFMIGHHDPFFNAMASMAGFAAAVGLCMAVLALRVDFKRQLCRTGESHASPKRLMKLSRLFFSLFDGVFLRNPSQRAIFHFFRLTVKKSHPHRIRLGIVISISIGLVLILSIYQGGSSSGNLEDNRVPLMIPLILSFFILIGARAVMKIPVSLASNWIFKITERRQNQHYFIGIRKGIFFLLLVPVHTVLFGFYVMKWGVPDSVVHYLFGLVISFLLMEILFFRFHTIAFTCTYVPGRERLHYFWFVYLVGFLVYVYSLSWVESRILADGQAGWMFFGFSGFSYVCLWIYKQFYLNKNITIKYDETPLAAMQTLDLSSK